MLVMELEHLKIETSERKNFKIRRIIEYPDTQEEGGGRERIGCMTGSLGLSLDFVQE